MKNLLFAAALLSLGACQAKRELTPLPEGSGIHIPRPEVVEIKQPAALPAGTIYRTSGDYNNNVFIILGNDGNILTYPAPSDVNASSAPLQLKQGWLLDRRGISQGAAFLTWTYEEYHALKSAPSPTELKAHIIPGAKVTAIERLPVSASEAAADTAAVNAWIMAQTRTLNLDELPQN